MPADRQPPTRPDQLAAAMRAAPMPVADPAAAPASDAPRRPNAITYPAALAMALGAAGVLFCGGTSGYQGFLMLAHPEVQLPNGVVVRVDQTIAQFMLAVGIADLVTSTALMVAGWKAMELRPWARKLALAVAPLIIVIAAVRGVAWASWIGPSMVDMRLRLGREIEAAAATRPATAPALASAPTRPSTSPATTEPTTTAVATTSVPATTAPSAGGPNEGGPGVGRQDVPRPATPDEIAASQGRANPFFALIMFVVQAAVPALILIVWTRRGVRDLFGRGR